MNITDVRVRIISKTDGKMKAVASINFDGCFVVHDIKIIEGHNGLFVAMPSRKVGEGDYKDIAHPINTETRNLIQNLILDKYHEAVLEQQSKLVSEPTQDKPSQEMKVSLTDEDLTLRSLTEGEVEEFETEELGQPTSL